MAWNVLYVASRSEKKVSQRLKDLGLVSYLPLKTEKKQWSDRVKTVSTPLISGYLFVQIDRVNRDLVFKAQGVLNYVRHNGSDAVIKDKEIAALRSIEEKGYYVEGRFMEELKRGDKVMIQFGPFKGLNGSVKVQAREHIYSIEIDGIGYALTVNVPKEVLTKEI